MLRDVPAVVVVVHGVDPQEVGVEDPCQTAGPGPVIPRPSSPQPHRLAAAHGSGLVKALNPG